MEPIERSSGSSMNVRKSITDFSVIISPSVNLKRRRSSIVVSKRTEKSLPENFFEKILDLELSLKREFTMDALQSIVNLYSTAIEYYESIEDAKYKDYQNRLNILLSQPEILKKMNEFYLKKGQNEKLKSNKIMNDYEKKHLMMKVNYITQLNNLSHNEDKVQEMIEKIEKEGSANDSSMIDEEMCKQSNNFQSRLLERRRRVSNNVPQFNFEDLDKKKRYSMFLNKLSGVNLHEFVNNKRDNINKHDANCEVKIIENHDLSVTKSSKSSSQSINSDDDSIESVPDENFEETLDNYEHSKIKEFNDLFSPIANASEKLYSGNESDYNNYPAGTSPKISDTSVSLFKLNENVKLSDSKNIGPKHVQMFFEVKETLDSFVNDFNFYFYEHVFQRFADHVQKLMDEKYSKYIEVTKIYHSQIKEMEFLITEDSEDEHKQGIINVIDSLKEEKDHELDKIEDHYNKLISEAQSTLKNFGFKNNPGIGLIEEKFKLDMYNLLNLILLPKK